MLNRFSLSVLFAVSAGCVSATADDNGGTTPFLPGGDYRLQD